MAQTSQVRNSIQARSSKLASKKRQLEQLLRKKARLDFEIKILKKSIQKDFKFQAKVSAKISESLKPSQIRAEALETEIYESLDLKESDDPLESWQAFLQLDKELTSIVELLLSYEEPLSEN